MAFTTPIFLPLTEGLDQSKDGALGQKELHVAENVDFGVQGLVVGRPSRAQPRQFIVPDPAGTPFTAPAYQAAANFDSTGLTQCGMLSLRDGSGERAMLATQGHLFTLDDQSTPQWVPRGAFGCMKVDVPHRAFTDVRSSLQRTMMAPTFAADTLNNAQTIALYDPDTFEYQRSVVLTSTPSAYNRVGGSARAGAYVCSVYVDSSFNVRAVIRNGDATSVTDALIDTISATWDNDGDAASVATDGTNFYVLYQTGSLNTYKVKKFNTSGTVSATFSSTLAGIRGSWLDVGSGVVAVGLTNASGLTVKILNTSLVDQSKDSTWGAASYDSQEVVVGVESSTRVWWANVVTGAGGQNGLYIGTCNPTSASSASLKLAYYADPVHTLMNYTPMHQPILHGGRMYLTVGEFRDYNVSYGSTGTWFTVDLSNLTTIGAYEWPTTVARGEQDTAAFRSTPQPESAVLCTDTGWTFPSLQYATFSETATGIINGLTYNVTLNRIRPLGTRSTQVGGSTIFSGSVPRNLTGNECYPHGFPQNRPFIGYTVQTHGSSLTNTVGSYTVYVIWSYTDAAGQVHRSGSSFFTDSLVNTDDYFTVYVSNPYFGERPWREVRADVYCTSANPTSGDPAYLSSSTAYGTNTPYLTVDVLKNTSTSVSTSSPQLYSLAGEFLHVTPCADGGITSMGRRVWVADRNTVYASLLTSPTAGVTFNDEGSLSVDLPAGAGHIVALEALDDKVIVFCSKGVFVIQDGGPDNVGQGPDIAFPVRLSQLGAAGPRSTCTTDRGVVFCTSLSTVDSQLGGPWLLDRALTLTERQFLGTPALKHLADDGTNWVPEVAFSPERQQVYVSIPQANEGLDRHGVLVVDMRVQKWATWSLLASQGNLQSIAVVDGRLWTLATRPAGYTGFPGSDYEGDYVMTVATAHLSADGRDGLGWAKVRAVSALYGGDDGTTHTLTLGAVQDQANTLANATYSVQHLAGSSTWPSSRGSPEYRLPNQKCSTVQVRLSATPAHAGWSGVRLDVVPLPPRAPAGQRS